MHRTAWAAVRRSGISPGVRWLTDTRQRLPHCPSRCRSSHRPPSQASRLFDLCTDINQPQLSDPCTTHHAPLEYAVGSHLHCCACRISASRFHTFQAADAAPRTARRRKQAVYSTSARTSIRLSSRIHAPHITRRWNTQWDLTSTAVPAGSAPAASTLSKQQMPSSHRPPSQASRLFDLCTDINPPQLSDPCTTHHAPLEYTVGSHLQCCACRIRGSCFGAARNPTTDAVLASRRRAGLSSTALKSDSWPYRAASTQHCGRFGWPTTSTSRSARCASSRCTGRHRSVSPNVTRRQPFT